MGNVFGCKHRSYSIWEQPLINILNYCRRSYEIKKYAIDVFLHFIFNQKWTYGRETMQCDISNKFGFLIEDDSSPFHRSFDNAISNFHQPWKASDADTIISHWSSHFWQLNCTANVYACLVATNDRTSTICSDDIRRTFARRRCFAILQHKIGVGKQFTFV